MLLQSCSCVYSCMWFLCTLCHVVIFVVCVSVYYIYIFFFQAEDGIRDLVRSRGLGDVYKRQVQKYRAQFDLAARYVYLAAIAYDYETQMLGTQNLSLIHI